ncbi:MAG: M28 family peptidase [Vicinamibacterales bacterium]
MRIRFSCLSGLRVSATASVLGLTVVALAGAQAGDDAGVETIRADALRGHIYFLAAPEMGGRDSLSLEGRIAANYIASFFYRLGLTPAGDGQSYFQGFPMAEATIDRAQTRLRATVTGKAGATTREYLLPSDFTLARQGGTDVDVKAPLVFAGYGIEAPEYGYNDYAGLDVAGKVVLLLSREPQAADARSPFKGTWDTYHAYPAWKPEVARRHGAAGVLIVQGTPRRPPRAASGPTNGQIRTDRPNHSLTSPFWDLPVFNIDARVANELLSASGKTVGGLQEAIDKAGTPQSSPLPGVTVEMRRAVSERRTVQTRNVVGVIEGTDAKLKDEYVLVTGHYDHVGQKPPFIFHGADDNASATAAVIAIAEAFKAHPPKRSVMFLVFEAEEDFLQGAFHYVDHPIVPLERTVAVLNMDMIGRDEESATWKVKAEDSRNSVNLIGTLYNPDLRGVIERQNQKIGLRLDYKTDADDREGWFSRSDHFPFAIKGVPMVLFNTGEHPDYHTANDTWDRINYPKMEKIVRLVYLAARDLADTATRPRFVTGNVPDERGARPQRQD